MDERLRLGELLVRAGLVSQQQLDEVLALQAAEGSRLGALLVDRGFLSETQVTQILSQQLSVPWVSLSHVSFSRDLIARVPAEIALRHTLVPIFVRRPRGSSETLYVAMDDPVDAVALSEVQEAAGLPVRPMIASPSDIRNAIAANYGVGPAAEVEEPEYTDPGETAPCSSMVPSFLLESAPPSSLTLESAPPSAATPALRAVLALTLADGSRTTLPHSALPIEQHLQKLPREFARLAENADWRTLSTSLLAWLEDRQLISSWELCSDSSSAARARSSG